MRDKQLAGVILAVLASACVAGCGGSTKTVTVRASATSTKAATTPATTSTSSTAASAPATTPLAQETVRQPCSPGATVTIAVLGLHVSGQLATLQLAFTPRDPNASASEAISLFNMTCNGSTDVDLVDPVGLKRYVVVKDSSNNVLQPDPVFGVRATSGQTATGSWVFAAPPASVTSVDVQVANWPTFNNIPIQR
jgi:hypothetical protein